MADYARFDALRAAAREHAARGDDDAAAGEYARALAVARAGFAEEPAAWVPRLGLLQRDISRAPTSSPLHAESEQATREVLAYAKGASDAEPDRRALFSRTANAFSMQLEAEQRIEESLAIDSDLLQFYLDHPEDDPAWRSSLEHTRGRTANLRLATGDAAGALELADALIEEERRAGSIPSEAPSGLPTWLRLRARALAALGRETEARADFDSSMEWERARVKSGRFLLAELDLADALDEQAAFLRGIGASEDAARAGAEAQALRDEQERIRAERKRLRDEERGRR